MTNENLEVLTQREAGLRAEALRLLKLTIFYHIAAGNETTHYTRMYRELKQYRVQAEYRTATGTQSL